MANSRPQVVFVLGGPGAGKGTQCANIIEHHTQWAHISAGDCLRAERQNKDSPDGILIESLIKEGKIVPVAITVKLLQQAMAAQQAKGKRFFLIDGFPRNLDNVTGWNENVGDAADVLGVLYFEAKDTELERRLLDRGETSGRSDDNIDSIRKRFKTFVDESMPIVEQYKATGNVFVIDGMPPPEEVWKVVQPIIRKFEAAPKPKVVFVLGNAGAGKGTQCEKIIENHKDWAHISAGDCLREERANKDSKDGELIESICQAGGIVPVAITVRLLMKAMAQAQLEGKNYFLIDGYPRNLDNVTGWTENVGDDAEVLGVLFFEADETALEQRLLSRAETGGRADDNLETIRKRFATFRSQSMPIVEQYKTEGKVFSIDGMPPAEEVWKVVQPLIVDFESRAMN